MLGAIQMNKDHRLKFCGKAVNVEELSLIKELAEELQWTSPYPDYR